MNKQLSVLTLIAALGFSGAVHAASISGQGTWESTLQGRDFDGNLATFEAYYDSVLNITWLADANYAGTTMTWADASGWATGLDPYGSGITGWRLPTVTDTGAPGCDYAYSGTDCGYNVDTATSEMASMFYDTLGNLAYYDTSGGGQPGWGLSNTGPFSNVQSYIYWSATEHAPGASLAGLFYFYNGYQNFSRYEAGYYYAWAVHAGDVGASAIPVPAAVWLFVSGWLGGMAGVARRKGAATRSSVEA